MDELKTSIVKSLDGKDNALLPFLPFLLQDLWEIGASPIDIIQLFKKHRLAENSSVRVLDLGCGKGAVSVNLAREFDIQVHGIDAMPEFINEARSYAGRYGVEERCTFEIGDIRKRIKAMHDFDVAILGSIGPVFGTIEETVNTVKLCLKKNGHITLDDGYLREDSDVKFTSYSLRAEIVKQFQRCHVQIIDEYEIEEELIEESNEEIFNQIRQRADELIKKYPEKRDLFEGYVNAQMEENEVLENHVRCVMWLLKQ